jgi:hypothetical protein
MVLEVQKKIEKKIKFSCFWVKITCFWAFFVEKVKNCVPTFFQTPGTTSGKTDAFTDEPFPHNFTWQPSSTLFQEPKSTLTFQN